VRLQGQVAVITGSTRGIGRTIGEVFSAEGARVVISGRSAEKGVKTVQRIRDAGGEATFVSCDVADEEAVRSLMETTVRRYGRLTTLVNNVSPLSTIAENLAPIGEMSTTAWEEIVHVGLTGSFFYTTKFALPKMIESGGGSIINISSSAAVRAVPGYGAYTTIKSAVHGLTLTTAAEYGKHGIRCNVLMLGRVEIPGYADHTTQNASEAVLTGYLGTPNDVAWASTWLASDESRYVTGAVIPVDGGYTAHNIRRRGE